MTNYQIKMSSSCEEETPLLTSQVSDDDINTERGYNAYTDSETGNSVEKQDNSWSWLVVLGSFYCVAIVGGFGYITGIIMESLIEDFSGDVTLVSIVGSLQVGSKYL